MINIGALIEVMYDDILSRFVVIGVENNSYECIKYPHGQKEGIFVFQYSEIVNVIERGYNSKLAKSYD